MRKGILKSVYLLALGLAITALSSCKKDETVLEGTAKLRLVNAYLNSDPQELYQDNTKLTQQAVTYGGYSNYSEVYTGRSVFWTNGAVENKATAIIEAVLYNDNNYTFFYYENDESKPSIIGYINQTKMPAAGKFRVRFVNLSVMFNNKPLVVNGSSSTILGALNYRDNPSYLELAVNGEIKVNLKDNAVTTTLDASKFQEGKSYTVWFDTNDGTEVGYHIIPES